MTIMTESKTPNIKLTFDGCYNYNRLQKEGMVEDWRYCDEKMELRQHVYNILLNKYGGLTHENGEPKHSMESITECCHDWVSQGHVNSNGIVKYYEAYYQ